MAKLLLVLLVTVVAVEAVAVLVIAGVLFWLAAPQTIGLGVVLLVASALAFLLSVRAVRAHP